MADGEAVGKEHDDVLRDGFLGRRVDVPVRAQLAFRRLHGDGVLAGLLDFHIAQDDGRTLGVDFLGNVNLVALQNLFVVLTVDLNLNVLPVDDGIELDLEVEARVRHEARLVDRINLSGLNGARGREGEKHSSGCGGEDVFIHVWFLRLRSDNLIEGNHRPAPGHDRTSCGILQKSLGSRCNKALTAK